MPCECEHTPYSDPDRFAAAGGWASARRGTALESYWAHAHQSSGGGGGSDWVTFHHVQTGKGIADFLHVNKEDHRFFFEDLHATERANYNGPFGPTTKKHHEKTQDKYADSPLAAMLRDRYGSDKQLPSGDSNPLTLN